MVKRVAEVYVNITLTEHERATWKAKSTITLLNTVDKMDTKLTDSTKCIDCIAKYYQRRTLH